MKILEERFTEWEEGTLTEEGIAELKEILTRPEARAELVGEWLFYEAVYRTLRASPTPAQAKLAEAAPKTSVNPFRQRMLSQSRRSFPWLARRGFRIALCCALGILALGALLLGGIKHYFEKTVLGHASNIRHPVFVERGGKTIPAQVGQPLYAGDIVHVQAVGAVTLTWEPGTQFVLAGPSDLKLLNRMDGRRFEMPTGALKAVVGEQPGRRALTIQLPQAEVRATGTRFRMYVNTNATRLDVSRGIVALRRMVAGRLEGSPSPVHPGETALASSGKSIQVGATRGYAIREIVELPSRKVIWSDELALLGTDGRLPSSINSKTGSFEELIRCYLNPPITGNYIFWISAGIELWLSSDDKAANRRLIAAGRGSIPRKPGAKIVPGQAQTNAKALPAVNSKPEKLEAGKRYYLELVHPCGKGDPAMVWWVKPGQPNNVAGEVIVGSALSPYYESTSRIPNP